MTLQASGAISLGDIQSEFGGSNPISISEYYGADTGVPGSGTISLSDFYGTSNIDQTMDNMFAAASLGPGDDVVVDTVSGINVAVVLDTIDTTGEGVFTWRKNSDSYQSISIDLTVSNGDTVSVQYDTNQSPGGFGFNGSIVIRNTSDSNTEVGTINCSNYS